MSLRMLFQYITFAFFTSTKCITLRNKIHQINVLAITFPPFTYSYPNNKFGSGIDIFALETIADRLEFELNFTRITSLKKIQEKKLK